MYRYKRYGEINNALQDIQNMESTASETPHIIAKEELKNCVNNIQEQQRFSTNNANVLSKSNQKHNNRSMNVHSKRRRDETHMDLLILQQEVKNTKVFSDKTPGRKAVAQVAAAAVQANKVAALNPLPNKGVDDGMGTKVVGKKRKMSEAAKRRAAEKKMEKRKRANMWSGRCSKCQRNGKGANYCRNTVCHDGPDWRIERDCRLVEAYSAGQIVVKGYDQNRAPIFNRVNSNIFMPTPMTMGGGAPFKAAHLPMQSPRQMIYSQQLQLARQLQYMQQFQSPFMQTQFQQQQTANFANAVNVGMRPGAGRGSSGVATANPPRKKGKIGLLSEMAGQLSDSSMVAPPKVPSFINKKVNGKTSAKKGAAGLLAPIAVRASKPIQIPPLDNPLLKIPDKD